ncbi:MAG: hypothetical protein HYU29_07305 [Chloroflexi bacterium]|nr:hypothetical protein [Chloroflexota bacterium]
MSSRMVMAVAVFFIIAALVWVGFGSYLLVKDVFLRPAFPVAFRVILPFAGAIVLVLMVASLRGVYRDWKKQVIKEAQRQ